MGTGPDGYEAAARDLDEALAKLRARDDLSPREQADERIRLLEAHLARVRALNEDAK